MRRGRSPSTTRGIDRTATTTTNKWSTVNVRGRAWVMYDKQVKTTQARVGMSSSSVDFVDSTAKESDQSLVSSLVTDRLPSMKVASDVSAALFARNAAVGSSSRRGRDASTQLTDKSRTQKPRGAQKRWECCPAAVGQVLCAAGTTGP